MIASAGLLPCPEEAQRYGHHEQPAPVLEALGFNFDFGLDLRSSNPWNWHREAVMTP